MIWILVGLAIGGLFIYLFMEPILHRLKREDKIIEKTKEVYVEKPIYKNNKGYEFARKKILDLQNQLALHELGEQTLHPTDVIRYRAMVEVLTQVLEINNG